MLPHDTHLHIGSLLFEGVDQARPAIEDALGSRSR